MRFNFLYYSVIVYVFVYIIIYYTDIERLIEIKSPLFLSADFYQTTLDSLCPYKGWPLYFTEGTDF